MSSHLSLDELIATANGTPVAAASAAHLSECGTCSQEARGWGAVAGGVGVLADRSAPPDALIETVLSAIGDTDRPSARRRGRWTWAAAAAGIVLVAAGGYSVSAALSSPDDRPVPAATNRAALTSTACTGLKATGGTATSIAGSSLVIRAARGPVRVTVSARTTVLREVAGDLGDVTDGARVTVHGIDSGRTIDAAFVGLDDGDTPRPPASPSGDAGGLRLGFATGTVADTTNSGFTLIEAGGTHVHIATSSATTVLTLARSRLGQLKIGKLTTAVGNPGPDGTLAATLVEQDELGAAPKAPAPPTGLPGQLPGASNPTRPPVRLGTLFSGLGCAQHAIASTYLLALEGSA